MLHKVCNVVVRGWMLQPGKWCLSRKKHRETLHVASRKSSRGFRYWESPRRESRCSGLALSFCSCCTWECGLLLALLVFIGIVRCWRSLWESLSSSTPWAGKRRGSVPQKIPASSRAPAPACACNFIVAFLTAWWQGSVVVTRKKSWEAEICTKSNFYQKKSSEAGFCIRYVSSNQNRSSEAGFGATHSFIFRRRFVPTSLQKAPGQHLVGGLLTERDVVMRRNENGSHTQCLFKRGPPKSAFFFFFSQMDLFLRVFKHILTSQLCDKRWLHWAPQLTSWVALALLRLLLVGCIWGGISVRLARRDLVIAFSLSITVRVVLAVWTVVRHNFHRSSTQLEECCQHGRSEWRSSSPRLWCDTTLSNPVFTVCVPCTHLDTLSFYSVFWRFLLSQQRSSF